MSISKKAARKSATAVAVVNAIPATPAPVTIIPAISDAEGKAKLAGADKKAPPAVAQSVVDAFLAAEGNMRGAAVDVFRACIHGAVTPAQFGARSDAKIRASEFNSAWKVRCAFGAQLTAKMIDEAASHGVDRRANVLRVLRKAKELAGAIKSANLKGAALQKALNKAATEAREAAAPTKPEPRGAQHRIGKAESLGAFASLALLSLGDMLEQLGKIDVAPRMLRKANDAREAIEAAVDAIKALRPAE